MLARDHLHPVRPGPGGWGERGQLTLRGLVAGDLGVEALLDLGDEVVGLRERLDQVLHVVALAADQAAQVEHHAAGLVALAGQRDVGVLEGRHLLLVALALALELLGNFLLEHQRLERIVALLLGAGQAYRQPGIVVLLLVDEPGQAAVLALVRFDLDLEVLGLLGKLLGEGLELEEL